MDLHSYRVDSRKQRCHLRTWVESRTHLEPLKLVWDHSLHWPEVFVNSSSSEAFIGIRPALPRRGKKVQSVAKSSNLTFQQRRPNFTRLP